MIIIAAKQSAKDRAGRLMPRAIALAAANGPMHIGDLCAALGLPRSGKAKASKAPISAALYLAIKGSPLWRRSPASTGRGSYWQLSPQGRAAAAQAAAPAPDAPAAPAQAA